MDRPDSSWIGQIQTREAFPGFGEGIRWREKFWGRRYQAIPISEEKAAQVERLRCVLAHGCKEGLVERLRDWPGVSAVRALLEEEPLACELSAATGPANGGIL